MLQVFEGLLVDLEPSSTAPDRERLPVGGVQGPKSSAMAPLRRTFWPSEIFQFIYIVLCLKCVSCSLLFSAAMTLLKLPAFRFLSLQQRTRNNEKEDATNHLWQDGRTSAPIGTLVSRTSWTASICAFQFCSSMLRCFSWLHWIAVCMCNCCALAK